MHALTETYFTIGWDPRVFIFYRDRIGIGYILRILPLNDVDTQLSIESFSSISESSEESRGAITTN
jgi:hypothetical protein